MTTEWKQALALCGILFATLALGVVLGTHYGRTTSAAECYRIKATQCLPEPKDIGCECLEKDREARVER